MSRDPLPQRRPSATEHVEVELDGKKHRILITVGFRDAIADRTMTQPAEVFCASFKVGTALNSIVSDACIILSRLYQYGDDPRDVAKRLCEPPSLVGIIAAAVAAHCPEKTDG